MAHRYETLLTPFVLGNGVVLRNRIVQPKCAPDQIQGPEEWPTEQFAHFHREAARKGSALVVMRDADTPEVRKMPEWHDFAHSYTFDTSNPAVQNYFCQIADDVHYYGSKILIMAAMPRFAPGVTLGGGNPEYIQSAEGLMKLPPARPATKEEIREQIDQIVARLVRYQSWGFDGAGIGVYGLEEETDLRTDEYGGCVENRCRFTLELCRAIKKACGRRFLIHVMQSGECEHGSGGNLAKGYTLDDMIVFLKKAESLVDLMSVREDSLVSSHPTGFTFRPGEHPCLDMIRRMKEAGVKIPLAAAGGFQEPDEMEAILRGGQADLISVGRGQFTDDDYYTKILEERGEDIRPCVRCNRCHGRRRAPWTAVCTVNPTFGAELKTKDMVRPVTRKKKVAVIGGGVAGMQAAITAAERGHAVTLFEKTGYLGGQLYFGDYFDFKWPFKNYRLWLIAQLSKHGVDVRLHTAPAPEQVRAMGFDAVIAAAGSEAWLPDIPGMRDESGAPALRTCHDVIGREETLGKDVIMVGCSETGIETACYLAQRGHHVTCLTRQETLAKDASPLHSITIAWVKIDPAANKGYMAPFWERFENLRGITGATTVAVTPTSAVYRDRDGAEHTIEGTDVIVCGGVRPRERDAYAYALCAPEFYVVGDAGGAKDIQTSVRSAFAAASQL